MSIKAWGNLRRQGRWYNFLMSPSSSRRGFTLIELLVVIAIIAILSIVVVLTLNPAETLRQSRDSNRVSDLDTLTHALSLYQTDQATSGGSGSLGTSTIIYVSLPDASSTCGTWNLPSPPTGYTYQCSSPSTYRKTDSSGWIPVNFSGITTGSPLGSLPIDPQNTSSTSLYYTYVTNGSQYEVTSLFESSKYKSQYAQSPTIPSYPEVNAKGSSFTINPLFNVSGLVGYWPMDEGVGGTSGVSQTADQSGSGNNGIWYGTAAGTNNTYYTAGKVGSWGGYFNGGNDYIMATDTTFLQLSSQGTLSIWINPATYPLPGNWNVIISKGSWSTGKNEYSIYFNGGISKISFEANGSSGGQGVSISNTNTPLNAWTLVAFTWNSSLLTAYINGQPLATSSMSQGASTAGAAMYIGTNINNYFFAGLIDDVRIYNRALSPSEISALYNAER